jgi:5-(carboxyamino)imidazole ribonucleotide synthase
MFAIAARRMGYRVHTFSPDADTPTGQVADVEITADYTDLDAVRAFARDVQVVTFEFENVPAETAAAAAELVPVRPGGTVLYTTQQRLREKRFLEDAGLPVAPFLPVRSRPELTAAIDQLGCPAILKSASFGYDGKGQAAIRRPEEAAGAWTTVGASEAILERFIDFDRELSVVAARGLDGDFAHYPVVQNTHRRGILDLSVAPAEIPAGIARTAVALARRVLEGLDVVGVLCVEFFLTRAGSLLINEIAPRPHNSGHFSFDACVTSQFEQQLRAVCGLPLGSTALLRPAAMANLLGDLWIDGEPEWTAACAFRAVKLHLYGKLEPRPGRKMGHLTALAGNPQEARQMVLEARNALTRHGVA